jgi:hypothetical protein
MGGDVVVLCLEIAGLAFLAMAFFAFGGIAELAFREDELHLDLASTGAKELLRYDPDSCVFAQNLGHG